MQLPASGGTVVSGSLEPNGGKILNYVKNVNITHKIG